MRRTIARGSPVLGALSAAAMLTTLAGLAAAQSPDAARAGYQLADKYCAECHVIVRNGPAGWTDAPSFPAIADRPGITAAAIESVVLKPHLHMLNLPRGERDARLLAAYILSLRTR